MLRSNYFINILLWKWNATCKRSDNKNRDEINSGPDNDYNDEFFFFIPDKYLFKGHLRKQKLVVRGTTAHTERRISTEQGTWSRRKTPFAVNFLLPFHALDNEGMCVETFFVSDNKKFSLIYWKLISVCPSTCLFRFLFFFTFQDLDESC